MENPPDEQPRQTPPSVPIDPAPPVVKPKRGINLILIITGIVILFLIIAIGLLVGSSLLSRPKKPVVTPPLPPPPPIEVIPPPATSSRFASDSALLKIREDLKSVRSMIDTTDLFDAQISPPNLDLGIQIKP